MNRNTRPSHAGLGMFLFVMVAFVLPTIVLLLMLHYEPLVISEIGDAGIFEAAASHDDLTNVRTSVGTITVSGGFSALNGQRLMLRRSNKFGLQLCPTEDPDNCAEVTGTWAGRMRSVPHPHHWYMIDFAKHQINSRTLSFTLMLGILVALAALLVTASEYAGSHPSDRDDPKADDARAP